MELNVRTFFSNSGPLALSIPNYRERTSQIEMSCMIENIFHKKEFGCIEAATGIGKTFAYLIPSIINAIKLKQKIIISTHTIALQEQIFHKDIPFLFDLLNIELPVVLVKGMNQYFCIDKFKKAQEEPSNFKNPYFMNIHDKLNQNDLAFFDSLSSTQPKDIWHKINADSLNCLSHACPYYKDCFFYADRKKVEDASILIVNHHLLLTDLLMKNQGQQQTILPESHHLIIDEAHHLASIAEELFSFEFSKNNLEARLKPKVLKEQLVHLSKVYKSYHEEEAAFFCKNECMVKIDAILENAFALFEFAYNHLPPDSQYLILDGLLQGLNEAISSLSFDLKDLLSSYDHLIKLAKELEIQDRIRVGLVLIEKLKSEISQMLDTLSAFLENKKDKLFFFEVSPYHQSFNCHYIEASKQLGAFFDKHFLSTIFCSATLTFDQRFESFKYDIGLASLTKNIQEGVFYSDFDYKKSMLFLVPSDMPEPHDQNFEIKIFDLCKNLIEITKGGVFVLFTSHEMLNKMAAKFSSVSFDFPINILTQGSDSKKNLIDSFKNHFHSVLFGTDSFWEGVDVQGDHLRCVIITKLPFKSPYDPIFQATSQKLKKNGKDPFHQKALPEACIKFKQGIGRLIRSRDDQGIVICADIRIIQKNYGKYFLKTLPNCSKLLAAQVHLLQKAAEFLKPMLLKSVIYK